MFTNYCVISEHNRVDIIEKKIKQGRKREGNI